jgi:hypothetical protein
MSRRPIIVVDGANVAYVELSAKGQPKVSNLVAVRRALEQKGYEPLIFVDASLIYKIDDRPQLEALINDQIIRQVPAATDADYFVLETADHYRAQIVSNDEFEPYRDRYPWIEDRRVPLMITQGRVELYEPKLEKTHHKGGK